MVNDIRVQKLITKIRPKDYRRTVLIYDFQYNLPINLLDKVERKLEKEVLENNTQEIGTTGQKAETTQI